MIVCAVVLMALTYFATQAHAQTVYITETVFITVEIPITETVTVTETVVETIVFTETEVVTTTETVTRTFTITVSENVTEEVVVTDTIVVTETVPVTTTLVITDGSTFEIDFSDTPDSYGLAAHIINESGGLLLIGNTVDPDSSAQPGLGTSAEADDSDNGVTLISPIVMGEPITVSVDVFNNTGEVATLVGYMDLNGDGIFTPDEEVRVSVPSSTEIQTIVLPFGVVTDPTNLYSRFRLTTESDVGPTGLSADGEVEDWFFRNPTAVQMSELAATSAAPLLIISMFVGVLTLSGIALSKKK